jgi:uncharacterized membrane protein YvbJ
VFSYGERETTNMSTTKIIEKTSTDVWNRRKFLWEIQKESKIIINSIIISLKLIIILFLFFFSIADNFSIISLKMQISLARKQALDIMLTEVNDESY